MDCAASSSASPNGEAPVARGSALSPWDGASVGRSPLDVGVERRPFVTADLYRRGALPGAETTEQVACHLDGGIAVLVLQARGLVENDGVVLLHGTPDQHRLHQGKHGEGQYEAPDRTVHGLGPRRQEPDKRHRQEEERHGRL